MLRGGLEEKASAQSWHVSSDTVTGSVLVLPGLSIYSSLNGIFYLLHETGHLGAPARSTWSQREAFTRESLELCLTQPADMPPE